MGASALAAAGGYIAGREIASDDDGGGGRQATAAQADAASDPLFELDPRYVNLTTFVLASHPRPVREAIERHRRKLDENAALYLREAEVALEEAARSALARYLEVEARRGRAHRLHHDGRRAHVRAPEPRPRRGGRDLRARLLRDPRVAAAARAARRRDGPARAPVREPESASVDGIVSAISRALGPRTRALALTWVHSSSGVKLPLREIAAAVAHANRGRRERERILLCVDGVHGFGVEDASPAALASTCSPPAATSGCSARAAPGFVWAAPHAWRRLAPTIPSFDPRVYSAWIEGHPPTTRRRARSMTPGGFHSFEHRWALPEAVKVHAGLGGRAEVARRTHARAAELKDGLAGIGGVRLRTPRDEALSAGLVCCEVRGIDPGDVVDRLREEHRVVASVTPYRTRYVRFGPSVANRAEDVRHGIEAVQAIARHA